MSHLNKAAHEKKKPLQNIKERGRVACRDQSRSTFLLLVS